jgi:hypothetical protein
MKSKGDYSEEWKRDDKFWNFVGIYCGIMMILALLGIFFMLFINVQHANAGELDAWEFNIMGINPADFEGRKWYVAAGGVIASLAVHEIGHLATSQWMGGDPYFDWSERAAMAGNGYENWNDDQKALYHGGGFLFQTVGGAILTAIPKTRHSDFTLGVNTMSMATGLAYGITGGLGDEGKSDVNNLDDVGYPGTAIALGSGLINGGLTYISLDKSDD